MKNDSNLDEDYASQATKIKELFPELSKDEAKEIHNNIQNKIRRAKCIKKKFRCWFKIVIKHELRKNNSIKRNYCCRELKPNVNELVKLYFDDEDEKIRLQYQDNLSVFFCWIVAEIIKLADILEKVFTEKNEDIMGLILCLIAFVAWLIFDNMKVRKQTRRFIEEFDEKSGIIELVFTAAFYGVGVLFTNPLPCMVGHEACAKLMVMVLEIITILFLMDNKSID